MIYTYDYNSPLGKITMASEGETLSGLWFEGQKYFADTIKGESEKKLIPVFDETIKWLDIYFGGKEPNFTPKISITGTPFKKAVAKIMLTIPYGKTMTYGAMHKKSQSKKVLRKCRHKL